MNSFLKAVAATALGCLMILFDVTTTGNGGRMIWSAKSRTADPDSVKDVQRGIAGLVVSELGWRNIITSKK